MRVMPIYGGGKTPKLGIGMEGEFKGILFAHTGADWVQIADLNQHADLISRPEEPASEEPEPKPKKSRRARGSVSETEGAET